MSLCGNKILQMFFQSEQLVTYNKTGCLPEKVRTMHAYYWGSILQPVCNELLPIPYFQSHPKKVKALSGINEININF